MPTRLERLRAEYAQGFGIHRVRDIDALLAVVDAARRVRDAPTGTDEHAMARIELRLALAALEEEA